MARHCFYAFSVFHPLLRRTKPGGNQSQHLNYRWAPLTQLNHTSPFGAICPGKACVAGEGSVFLNESPFLPSRSTWIPSQKNASSGPFAAEADAAARLREVHEVDRLELHAVLRVAEEDHLLPFDHAERTLFLMMTTLIGRRYFTAVANSPISMVKPPSPTKATDCRPG